MICTRHDVGRKSGENYRGGPMVLDALQLHWGAVSRHRRLWNDSWFLIIESGLRHFRRHPQAATIILERNTNTTCLYYMWRSDGRSVGGGRFDVFCTWRHTRTRIARQSILCFVGAFFRGFFFPPFFSPILLLLLLFSPIRSRTVFSPFIYFFFYHKTRIDDRVYTRHNI